VIVWLAICLEGHQVLTINHVFLILWCTVLLQQQQQKNTFAGVTHCQDDIFDALANSQEITKSH